MKDHAAWLKRLEGIAVPLGPTGEVVRFRHCPQCDGRGYFLINPFATSCGGFGGIANIAQCLTCLETKRYFNEHGVLPEPFAANGGAK